MKLRGADSQIAAASLAALLVLWLGRGMAWTAEHFAGAALLVLGYVFWLAARLQLRKYFAVRAKASGLVTTGIYGKIRNPIYIFGTMFYVGVFLYLSLPLWVLAALLVILVPLQVWRARNEARVLEEKFGEEYREYRRKTWL
jgi:protein-S-isoprenylcysteine O-methyltransferase Ste14